ncbi:MAG TPA: ABC transporter substrate-binding protein [Thermodesulfobacteriota bacterium]|nr:ABC transporter substrate-binding protein [Thermodesulfobacteriota bacterium]
MIKRALPVIIILALTAAPLRSAFAGDKPERIVSLSPNITQMIDGLGALDKVVGVTLYTDSPPKAKELPKVGGWINPNYEAILALKPDLVILMKDQDTIFGAQIRKLGLKTLVTDSNDSVSDIMKTILYLGEVLGREAEAQRIVSDMKSRLDRIRRETAGAPKKKVLLVVGRNPGTLEDIYVIGRNNYINELIEIAGGVNAVENTRLSIKITKEAILTLDPDVIIEINHEKLDKEAEILGTWNTLTQSRAVRDGQVYILPSTVVLHPSQTIVEGAQVLTDVLHPEIKENYGNNN